MLRRRRFLFLALSLAAVMVGLPMGMWLMPRLPSTAITRENAERIESGITLGDVERILGGPARDECSGPVKDDEGGFNTIDFPPDDDLTGTAQSMQWKSDRVSVTIDLDAHNRVICCDIAAIRRETLLETLRRWAGL